MSNISITKIFHFEAAHALSNHGGKCRNLHGHSYELHVTITATELNRQGMILDLGDLKKIVKESVLNEFDHALILRSGAGHLYGLSASTGKMIWLEKEPTVEHLLEVFAHKIQAALPAEVQLLRMKLSETGSSYGEWVFG